MTETHVQVVVERHYAKKTTGKEEVAEGEAEYIEITTLSANISKIKSYLSKGGLSERAKVNSDQIGINLEVFPEVATLNPAYLAVAISYVADGHLSTDFYRETKKGAKETKKGAKETKKGGKEAKKGAKETKKETKKETVISKEVGDTNILGEKYVEDAIGLHRSTSVSFLPNRHGEVIVNIKRKNRQDQEYLNLTTRSDLIRYIRFVEKNQIVPRGK